MFGRPHPVVNLIVDEACTWLVSFHGLCLRMPLLCIAAPHGHRAWEHDEIFADSGARSSGISHDHGMICRGGLVPVRELDGKLRRVSCQ